MKKTTNFIPFLSLLLLLVCLSPSASVEAQTGTLPYRSFVPIVQRPVSFASSRIGPSYGRALGVMRDPLNPSVYYAMTYGSGMYKSYDNGGNWSPISVGISFLTIQSMAVDPVAPGTVYAGTQGDVTVPYTGVFKTTDGGETWYPTGEMVNVWNGVAYNKPVVYALAVDPNNHNRVFAGTRMKGLPSGSLGGGGVFRSENGGATWVPVNRGLPNVDLYIYDLAIDPNTPGLVYAALHEHGLYRSYDYGNNWQSVSGTPYAGRAIVVDPFNPAQLYFGAVKKLGGYRSINYGASWGRFGGADWDYTVGGISLDPYHPGRIYSGVLINNTDYRLMRAENPNGPWTAVATLNSWGRITFAPDGQTALIGVDFEGPYKTTNGGFNWSKSAQGLTGFSVTGLVISPNNPNVMLASLYGLGVYATNDGGANWWPSRTGVEYANLLDLAIDANNPAVLYATTTDAAIYRSTDGGVSWSPFSGGYPSAVQFFAQGDTAPPSPLDNRPVPPLDWLPEEPEQAAPEQSAPEQSAALAGMATGNDIAVSPLQSNVVLVATAGRGIYRLNGSTWAASSLASGTAYAICFDRTVNGRVLAGVSAGSGSILVSTNNGQTWAPSNTGIAGRTVYSLAYHPAHPLVFLAGTDSGVYVTSDGGSTWVLAGLSGQVIKAVDINWNGQVVYFAGTEKGAHYSVGNPYQWNSLNTNLANIGIQGIVRAPGGQSLYFFTRLGGIVRMKIE